MTGFGEQVHPRVSRDRQRRAHAQITACSRRLTRTLQTGEADVRGNVRGFSASVS